MYRRCLEYILLVLSVALSTDGRMIRKGPANETLLVGQILGPAGDAARNLKGMLLSIDVFHDQTVLHQSLLPIEQQTFPMNYSVALTKHDFEIDKEKKFSVIAMIWQPAYIFEQKVKLLENEKDSLDIHMQGIHFVMIRGKILPDSATDHPTLLAKQVKLELIEVDHHDRVIEQVDFACPSNQFPCPFEYLLSTARIKKDHHYRLEAVISDEILPSRKSAHQPHANHKMTTASTNPKTLHIDPSKDNAIEQYAIHVTETK